MEGFKNLLDNVHCILRDKLGIKGMVAMRCIISLFQLKLIEPKLIEYNKKCSNEEKKINEICYFKNIIEFTDNNNEGILISHMIPFTQEQLDTTVFGILLSHEETKMFFKRDIIDKFRKLKSKQSILKNLLNKINKQFPESLTVTNYDQFGEAYEEFLSKQISSGQSLGQFFTPRIVINYISELLNPDIGKTVYDPTSGTGGFIMALYKFMSDKKIIEGKKKQCIKQLKNNTFFGGDIDDEVIDLLRFNLYMHGINLDEEIFRHGNSFLHGYENKFDYIAANPPFGMKKIDFAELAQELPGYYSIESGKGELLFLQHMYKALKVGGECAVIVPEGVLNNTNKDYKCVRELLLNNCVMKSIISLPSGIFNNTGVKTSIFHFVKGGDTKTVQYKEFKVIDENKWEIIDTLNVEIDKIKNNNYLLNPDKYIEVKEIKYKEGIVLRTLGDVCEFQNGSQLDKKDTINGNIPIFGGGVKIVGYHNTNNRNGHETIVCGTGAYSGYVNHNYGNPFWASQCFTMKSKNINIMIDKYLYYCSKIILEPSFMSNQKGTAIPFIRYTQVIGVKIPIPSLEQQTQIVEHLDFLHEECIKTSMKKIQELKKVNEIMMLTQSRYGDNVVRTLGDVCNINIGGTPSRNKNEYYEKGNNLWASVRELNGGYISDTKEKITDLGVKNSSVKLFAKDTVLFSFKLSIGKTAIVGVPLYTNEAIAGIVSKIPELLLNKYIYYYMSFNDFSKLASGIIGAGSLNKKSLGNIKISIPPIEQQTQIVEQLDNNTTLIEQLEKEIARCKLLSNKIMSSLVSKDEQIDNNKPEIIQETKTSKKIYKLDKDNSCQSTEIDEHNISNSDTPRIKNKKIVKKEYNSDNDETKHIVSDKPNIKNKKVVKKEYISDNDEQETKHIVSEKPNIKKEYISDNDNQHTKTKKYYMADDTTDSIKPRIKKIIKKEYVETVEDDNIEMQYKKKTKNVKRNT